MPPQATTHRATLHLDRTARFVILFLALLAGCRRSQVVTSSPAKIEDNSQLLRHHESIRVEAMRPFERAWYYKPSEESKALPEAHLVPLILQELAADATAPRRAIGSWDAARFDSNKPIVYYEVSESTMAGGPDVQVSFVWWYAPEFAAPAIGASNEVAWLGFRILLDEGGVPVVWEVLSPEMEMRSIFVSSSFERAAAGEFGAPLPGRRYSSEAALSDGATGVVARVIEDGPQPLGPWVYVNTGNRVSTLLCRCMPSQVNTIVGTTVYDLRPWTDLPGLSVAPYAVDKLPFPPGIESLSPGTGADFLVGTVRFPDRSSLTDRH